MRDDIDTVEAGDRIRMHGHAWLATSLTTTLSLPVRNLARCSTRMCVRDIAVI